MSRAGEVALGIIGTILNVLFLLVVTLTVMGLSSIDENEFKQIAEEEMMLTDPNMTAEDLVILNDVLDTGVDIIGVVGWVLIITLLISVILSIVAVVKVSKNKSPKTAGILFIVSGLLSGILLLAPILFYIAAIMCFVRKTPKLDVDDPFYNNELQDTKQPY